MDKKKFKKLNKYFPEDMLDRLAQIETSGGKNLNHPVITNPRSEHYGMKAVGTYGLMPKTIANLVSRDRHNPAYEELKPYLALENPDDPIDNESLDRIIKEKPELERQLASALLKRVERNVGGDPMLGAVAWHAGTSLGPQRIKGLLKAKTNRGNQVRDYAQKFQKLMKLTPKNLELGNLPVNKAPLESNKIKSSEPMSDIKQELLNNLRLDQTELIQPEVTEEIAMPMENEEEESLLFPSLRRRLT